MSERRRYRFIGRWIGRYWWQATLPGDSRVVEISCPVDWFWTSQDLQQRILADRTTTLVL